MDCTQTEWLSNKEYMQQFNKKVALQRIPLSGSIDITHRCNLKCVHCYLGGNSKDRDQPDHDQTDHDQIERELDTSKWCSIIDEITDAGCLYLLITGGEPLLRRDFAEIYTHAKKKGMLVTVFTNGTLIDEKTVALFKEMPPIAVEISLYGATPETYEKITGIKDSFEKCINGIETLKDNGINVKLKTILMTHNCNEFEMIQGMADKYGVKFRFDAAIFPCFNGDKAPVDLRVDPKEAVDIELADKDRLQQWQDYYSRIKAHQKSDFLYICGSGNMSFNINSTGRLQPCLMAGEPSYNLLRGSFKAGWQKVIPGIRKKKADKTSNCWQCEKKALCGFCPAFFNLENGAEDIPSDYLCAMGQSRFEILEKSSRRS